MRIEFQDVSPIFYKAHLMDLPDNAWLHYLTDLDRDLPHDHPMDMQTWLIFGGYTERRYAPDGSYEVFQRNPGDHFHIGAHTIHQIIDFHGGPTVTASVYGPICNTWANYDWRDGVMYRKAHTGSEWVRM